MDSSAGNGDAKSTASAEEDLRLQLARRTSKASSTVTSRFRALTFRSQRSVQTVGEPPEDVRGQYGLILLSSPSEPAVDFVFVHGLKGGSRKTWSESEDPMHFWPKEWLPRDPDFKHARIHSFGYKADWKEKQESILNIHDFGKSLLAALYDSRLIRHDASLPLVMVGHSMGGLVIKKAYILARRDPMYRNISDRFHTMFFIATPHRGAGSAQLLFNILRLSNQGSQPYLAELERNSVPLESINDEFRHLCDHLKLYSFYETVPTTKGLKSSVIVDKHSAILGAAHERTACIYADHRGVCKFHSPADSNYLILRDAFATTVDDVVTKWAESKLEEQRDQKRRIEDFLGIHQTPEDEYLRFSDLRAKDSCDWLLEKQSFQDWRDSGSSNIYWLSANPASGKSVMSAHVVKHLEDSNRTCSYFFFTSDSKSDSNLSTFLRSIAYQMALSNVYVRDSLLAIIDDGFQLVKKDFRAIWQKLFMNGILHTELYEPYYWVLDGLDECDDRHELIAKLEEIDREYPLRIFITSRPSAVPPQRSELETLHMHVESVSEEDTSQDIRLLVEANMHHVPAKERPALISEIVEKADGCFLWVQLVVDELRGVYSPKDVERILDNVPTGMNALYLRILDKMEQAAYGKETAKAILTWTALSARPLTVDELDAALELDIEDSVFNLSESASSICGGLVYVDSKARVRMIHQTAREFLMQNDLESEFVLKKSLCHFRLARICLEYLLGDEMRAPRGRRASTLRLAPGTRPPRSPFANYAASCFSEHIRGASSTNPETLTLLNAFLTSSNVLCWIEIIAESGRLEDLVRTGKVIHDFLRRRNKHLSPLGEQFKSVTLWSVDLLRLASKFGQQLLMAPWSIYNLVAPFCPPESALHRQFGTSNQSILVKGLSAKTWDDRTSCYVAGEEQTSSVAYAGTHYAVGYSSGMVTIFQTSTCQVVGKVYHEELVKCLQFSHSERLLAAGGLTSIYVFNVLTGARMLKLDTQHQCLTLWFDSQDKSLTAALRSNETMAWDISTGDLLNGTKLVDDPMMGQGQKSVALRSPNAAAYSQELDLLAVIFRSSSIMLWDLQSNSFYGYCDRESSDDPDHRATQTWPMGIVFSPTPNLSRLAAVYWDGDLVLFDPLENRIVDRTGAGGEVLACSPDGRTLATGDSAGNIQLFDFESLKLLYKINSWDHGIKSLAFSQDGLRFIDIRGSTCNVWEPPELIRPEHADHSSDSDALSSSAKVIDLADDDDLIMVTAVALHPAGKFILCGKDDGSVGLYHPQTGLEVRSLYSHAHGAAITHLEYDQKTNMVASCDESSTVLVYKLSNKPVPDAGDPVLRIRADDSISQILILHQRFVVVSESTIWLYDLNGKLLKSLSRKRGPAMESSGPIWKWLADPLDPSQVLVFDGDNARIFTMQYLESATELEFGSRSRSDGVFISGLPSSGGMDGHSSHKVFPCFNNKYLAILSPPAAPLEASYLSIIPSPQGDASCQEHSDGAVPGLSSCVARIIGSFGPRLVFIDRQNWVSSVESGANQYARHFCIPFDWLGGGDLVVEVAQPMVVFIRKDEIAVVRNCFAFSQYVSIA